MMQETPEIVISSIIHPKTPNVQNLVANKKKFFPETKNLPPVREYLTLPFPDFANIFYEIIIWAQYQEQMNEILQKIWYNYDHMDSFVMPVDYDGKKGTNPKGKGYYFVGFREGSIASQSNVEEFTNQERVIKYIYTIKTWAYFMLDPDDEALSYGDKDGKPVVEKYQNFIDIKVKETIGTLEEFEDLFG